MTRIHLILALLMGALFLTFGIFGCDPENPGDDDDVTTDDDDDVSDDDTSDDDTGDDDDTTGSFAEGVFNLPEELGGGRVVLENDTYVGDCLADPTCSIRTTHLGPHTACVEDVENALFLCLEINITELISQQEILVWSGPDGEWGLAPNGTYDVYEGAACGEGGDYLSTEEIETTIDGDEINLYIVGSYSFTVYGEYFGPSAHELIGTIDIDLFEFEIVYPTVTHCYILQ